MHTICLRSPIDESSPLPYKSIRQPLENAHSCQALCSLMTYSVHPLLIGSLKPSLCVW
ncbi:BDM_1a_G0037780.mRNA.1.CDS.1 [Saccharomyces cerevisiae]|nr:BDM_1a_G0037780.mRNA.1.CDS.1 [Saccharomyces cerevisiae]CAI7245192.1 BDM_1a_G0037780.mRNA.1.CDS.1 [Saccharomyces cerevisiae]